MRLNYAVLKKRDHLPKKEHIKRLHLPKILENVNHSDGKQISGFLGRGRRKLLGVIEVMVSSWVYTYIETSDCALY